MAEIDRLTVRLQADVKDLKRGMRSAETTVKRSSSRMEKGFVGVNRSLKNVTAGAGKLRTALIGLGGILALRAIVKQFIDFDISLSKVVALVGVSEESVAKFREEILKLAPAVGIGPGELADALFFVTSAGLRGAEAMDVLTKSAQASAVGLGETKTIAGAVTSVLAAYGTENIDAARTVDTLFKAVREGKFEAAELAAALGKVLSAAQASGVELEEVLGVVAALTRIGLSASEAITGLVGVFSALARESTVGEERLEAVGSSFAKLRKEVRENLLDALIDLGNALDNDAAALTDVFGRVEATNLVLALTGPLADQVATIFNSTADAAGAMGEGFEFIAGTPAFKLRQALSELGAQMINIGSVVVPVLVDTLGILGRGFDKLRTSVQRAREALGQFNVDLGLATLEELERRLAAVNAEIERLADEPEILLGVRKAFGELTGIPVMTVESLVKQRNDILAAIKDLRAEAAAALAEPLPPLPPIGTVGTLGGGLPENTEDVKAARDAVDALIVSLEDEVRVLSEVGLERELLAARIQAENILTAAEIDLNDEAVQTQMRRLASAVEAGHAQERLNEITEEGIQITADLRTPTEEYNDALERLGGLLRAGAISAETFQRATVQAQEELSEALEETNEQTERLNAAAERLGFTFASAFEDAVIAGEGLRGILQGLAEDIQRIILRLTVTEPIANFFSGIISGLFTGAAAGAAGGGFVTTGTTPGGIPVGVPTGHGGGVLGVTSFPRRAVSLRAFRGAPRMHEGGALGLQPGEIPFIGRRGETLRTPAQEAVLGRGGPTFLVDARGADVAAVQRLERFVAGINGSLETRAVEAVADAAARGRRFRAF